MSSDFDQHRLLWPDHLGLARGQYLTPEKAMGETLDCIERASRETSEYLPFP